MVKIAVVCPNSRARKGGKDRGEVKGGCGGVCGEEVQPSQQHVAPCVKGV